MSPEEFETWRRAVLTRWLKLCDPMDPPDNPWELTTPCMIRRSLPRNTGYPGTTLGGVFMQSHRWMYKLWHGDLPPRPLMVLHKCDRPMCIAPDHLFAGSNADNMRDKIAKGRHNNCGRKLSVQDVIDIKRRGGAGESGNSIAKHYPVSKQQVHFILAGKRHAKVQP